MTPLVSLQHFGPCCKKFAAYWSSQPFILLGGHTSHFPLHLHTFRSPHLYFSRYLQHFGVATSHFASSTVQLAPLILHGICSSSDFTSVTWHRISKSLELSELTQFHSKGPQPNTPEAQDHEPPHPVRASHVVASVGWLPGGLGRSGSTHGPWGVGTVLCSDLFLFISFLRAFLPWSYIFFSKKHPVFVVCSACFRHCCTSDKRMLHS